MDDPKTSHPFYWAAFIILGDGAKPLVPTARDGRRAASLPTGRQAGGSRPFANPDAKKPAERRAFWLVAGAGFEPATFRL